MNPQAPLSSYVPEKPRHIRTALLNLCYLLIFQGVSWILHIMVLGNVDPNKMSSEAAGRIPVGMFIFSVVALLAFGDILVGVYFMDSKRKRAYLAATSAEIRGADHVAEGVARYRKLALIESLICTLTTAAFWLIPTIIYTVSLSVSGRGYGYSEALIIEKFFVSFVGLCEPFQNAWIGWLIGIAVMFLFHYLGRLITHHRWEIERIRR